ncbi:unnamed protein product [Coffea canephora]|uniref:Uncharacterized protein n=1 Tax=Coffea canephora TaxID=49390 RepID=A0A068UIS1_COFCA|nr:unnamed protein product [Coffea canephora]
MDLNFNHKSREDLALCSPKIYGVDYPLLNPLIEPNFLRKCFVIVAKVGYFHQQECCIDASLNR